MAHQVKLPSYCVAVMFILLQALNVQGQAGFPSGTTINCYDGNTCTTLYASHTLDYGAPGFFSTATNQQATNPCCFYQRDPPVVNTGGYYSVGSNGTCQSCSDPNVQFRFGFGDISCYNSDNPTCSGAPAETDKSLFSSRAVLNSCCGGLFNLGYYNATAQGECLPCNPPTQDNGGNSTVDPPTQDNGGSSNVDPPTQCNGGNSNLSSMLTVLVMIACSMIMLSL